MLISCPSCAAGYDVPDHLLADGGQSVRCARCLHEWVQTLPAPELPPAPPMLAPIAVPASPPREPMAHPAFPAPSPDPPRPYSLAALATAWVLTLLFIALLGFGALYWRDQIMAGWPPSQRLYVMLGLR